MQNRLLVVSSFTLVLLLGGCGKKHDHNDQDHEPQATPAAATESTEPEVSSAIAATAHEDPDVIAKRDAINFALAEDAIKNNPDGQWAISAKASSTYAANIEDQTLGYHPQRAAGVPDTSDYGDKDTAWATKEPNAGIEWIELTFAKPVNATEVKVRQSFNPGAIIKIELFDEAGTAHSVWQGPDMAKYISQISWLNAEFEKTAYKTQRLKITLATNAVSGWNEIDAVQLVGN
jgi:hypothetical protein